MQLKRFENKNDPRFFQSKATEKCNLSQIRPTKSIQQEFLGRCFLLKGLMGDEIGCQLSIMVYQIKKFPQHFVHFEQKRIYM
jgi:hypothetical protein